MTVVPIQSWCVGPVTEIFAGGVMRDIATIAMKGFVENAQGGLKIAAMIKSKKETSSSASAAGHVL